jgi:hypothetical protein
MDIDLAREAQRVNSNNWQARNKGLQATLTLEEWLAILEKFQGLCAYCEHEPFSTLDHLIPFIAGGGTVAENCVPACRVCNSRKCSFRLDTLEGSISPEEYLAQVRLTLLDPSAHPRKGKWRKHRPFPTICKTASLDTVDWQAIEAIKTEHGITSDSDAIRFALRMALREIEKSRLPHPKQGSRTSSPA